MLTGTLRWERRTSQPKPHWEARHYHVYVIECRPQTHYYIGITANLPGRLAAHRQGHGSAFTRQFGFTSCPYVEWSVNLNRALQREASLLHEYRTQYPTALVCGGKWDRQSRKWLAPYQPDLDRPTPDYAYDESQVRRFD